MRKTKLHVRLWNKLRGSHLGNFLTKNKKTLNLLENIFRKIYPPKDIIFQADAYRIIINTSDTGIARRYLLDGEHEGFEKEYVLKNINFRQFIDIGANVGDWSLYFAAHKDNCIITAFEPHPVIFKRFTESIKLNKFTNISAHNVALGSIESELDLYSDTENNGNNSLLKINDFVNCEVHKVKVEPISKFLKNHSPDRLLIKMDVQGFEHEILKGISNEEVLKSASFILEFDKYTSSETITWINEMIIRKRRLFKLDEKRKQVTIIGSTNDLIGCCKGDEFFDILIY